MEVEWALRRKMVMRAMRRTAVRLTATRMDCRIYVLISRW
jgi:hypothetical protein